MKLTDLIRSLFAAWPAKALSLAAALMVFLLAQTAMVSRQEFTVYPEVKVPEGFEIAQPADTGVRVIIRGPSNQIFSVLPEHISLEADFSHVGQDGVYRAYIRLRDVHQARLFTPLEIDYQPRVIEVEIQRSRR